MVGSELMKDEILFNPVTLGNDIRLVREFDIGLIKKKYLHEIGIDVTEYFEGLTSVQLFKCLKTGYRFYFPFSLAGKSQFYDQLYEKQNGYDQLRYEHRKAMSFLRRGQTVCEIGCGAGNFLQFLKENGVSGTGIESSETAAMQGQRNGLLNIMKAELDGYVKAHTGTYDAVCAFQVLEHIPFVSNFILNLKNLLKPGGLMILGIPNNNPYLFRYDFYHTLNLPPHHMGLWNEGALKKIAPLFDLKLENLSVEPLHVEEIENYFLVQQAYYENKTWVMKKVIETLFFNSKTPKFKNTMRQIASKFLAGRHMLAVYRKSGKFFSYVA